MNKSEKLDKFAPALAKAQSEMGGAVKDSNNPFFKSQYADLTSVWKACKTALHSNGFSVIQAPVTNDTRIGVSTMLLHESGQFVEGEYTLAVKKQNDPQADGSSLTYCRRYALAAFVGICPVDDDGEKAMVRNKPVSDPFLSSMKMYATNHKKEYWEVMNDWGMKEAKKITNPESQEHILSDIAAKIGKKVKPVDEIFKG